MAKNWWGWYRVLYGLPLSITGVIHLLRPQDMVENLTSFIPGGLGLMYVAGLLWLVLGALIAFDKYTKYAAWGVIILLCAYQIMVHVPAWYSGEYLAVVLYELLRDLSLMAGAFMVLWVEHSKEEVREKAHHSWQMSLH